MALSPQDQAALDGLNAKIQTVLQSDPALMATARAVGQGTMKDPAANAAYMALKSGLAQHGINLTQNWNWNASTLRAEPDNSFLSGKSGVIAGLVGAATLGVGSAIAAGYGAASSGAGAAADATGSTVPVIGSLVTGAEGAGAWAAPAAAAAIPVAAPAVAGAASSVAPAAAGGAAAVIPPAIHAASSGVTPTLITTGAGLFSNLFSAKLQSDANTDATATQSKAAADALAYEKSQAAYQAQVDETNRKANYDQVAARSSQLSDLSQGLGGPSRSMPAYVPGPPSPFGTMGGAVNPTTPPSAGTSPQTGATPAGDPVSALHAYLASGMDPAQAAAKVNQQFNLQTGSQAVYYPANATTPPVVGLPSAYIAQTNGQWNITQRSGGSPSSAPTSAATTTPTFGTMGSMLAPATVPGTLAMPTPQYGQPQPYGAPMGAYA